WSATGKPSGRSAPSLKTSSRQAPPPNSANGWAHTLVSSRRRTRTLPLPHPRLRRLRKERGMGGRSPRSSKLAAVLRRPLPPVAVLARLALAATTQRRVTRVSVRRQRARKKRMRAKPRTTPPPEGGL
ncbi:unnamed protein product, partial [Ectocarpus sp. 13 AM-2016]